MSWTTPRTWNSTDFVTAAQLNTHVRDNLAALYPGTTGTTHPYLLRVNSGGSQTFTSNVFANMAFNIPTEDNWSAWSGATNSYIAPLSGLYLVNVSLGDGVAGNTNMRRVQIVWTGGSIDILRFLPSATNNAESSIFSGSHVVRVSAGGSIAAAVSIPASGTLTMYGAISIAYLFP